MSYYFISTDDKGEIKMGKTWSPAKDSTFGRLIAVTDKLHKFQQNKNYDFKRK